MIVAGFEFTKHHLKPPAPVLAGLRSRIIKLGKPGR